MKGFTKVTSIDYYGTVDGLCGKELKAGDKVELLFPDGTVEKHTLRTEAGTMQTQVDMNNHPDTHEFSKAYIERNISGTIVKIFLKGSGIKVKVL